MPKNLTPRQQKTIAALVTCADVAKAAGLAGVSRDSVYRWMRNSVFTDALYRATSEALNTLSRRLVVLGDKAAYTLETAMNDEDTNTSTKVRAADVVLSRLLQLREQHDLEERLVRLEENYERKNKN
jgi:hypothetical protein